MRLGLKPLPSNGIVLGVDLELTTASATGGVCTITVFFVPLSSQPAAFATAITRTPPIRAATIAISAGEPGRARTQGTVAAGVLHPGAQNPLELPSAEATFPPRRGPLSLVNPCKHGPFGHSTGKPRLRRAWATPI